MCVASAGGRLVEELAKDGVRHVALPLDRRLPHRLWQARRHLRGLLREERPDVVHAHARIPAFLAARLARRYGMLFVTSMHARFRLGFLQRRLSRWGYATAAVSEDLCQYLCERYGVDPSNVSVIPNGVDTARFAPSDKPADGVFRIFCMSRMDHDCADAARMLCHIAKRLGESIPNSEITLAGNGDAYAEICREAEQSGARIRMVGYLSDPVPFLQKCDVFVGVSRAALEAMSCGTCIVLGGNEGFFGVLNAQNAPLAAYENFCARGCERMTEERLTAALLSVWKMGEAERLREGMRLRQYVLADHSAEKMAEKCERFYHEARRCLPDRRGEILLCGYYGYGNMGDDALLRAAKRRAQTAFPDCGLAALTRGGRRDEWRFGMRCVCRLFPWSVCRAIRNARVLVFGGGTLLQDTTSRRSLRYYTFLIGYASRYGVACELWGNGIGPLHEEGSRRAAARALRACRFVGVRDKPSYDLAVSLVGKSAHIVTEDDLALGLLPSREARIRYLGERYFPRNSQRVITVAVKGRSSRQTRYALMTMLYALSLEKPLFVWIVMCPREDQKLTEAWIKKFGGVLLSGVGASDLSGLLSRCDTVLSMRLHALVFAAAKGVRFVGFGNDPKLVAFCREHGGIQGELYGQNGVADHGAQNEEGKRFYNIL